MMQNEEYFNLFFNYYYFSMRNALNNVSQNATKKNICDP